MTEINELNQGILGFLHKKAPQQDIVAVAERLKMAAQSQNVLLEVTSAVPLNSSQKEQLKLIFSKRLKSKFKIKNIIDKDIIAGLIIRYKDLLLDASFAGKLELLRQSAYGY